MSTNDRRENDDEFDKSAKNDSINEERGVDNSIGEEGTTNNKFDEVSITNDKIEEERASRASRSVDEYAAEKMRQRGLPCQEDCAE